MRIVLDGACGTAQLAVTGNATPGGTITIATTGTPSTSAFLFVSLTSGDAFIPYHGNLLIGFTPIWLLVPWPNIPSSVPAPLPSFLPVPLDLYLQILVTYASNAGCLTNLAVVEVRCRNLRDRGGRRARRRCAPCGELRTRGARHPRPFMLGALPCPRA